MPRVGDVDGFGRYGILEETPDGLLCHDCGWVGAHLGLHAYRAHGERADAYKSRHGLLRSRGLVAAPVRSTIQANARAGLAGRSTFVTNRDPAAATAARLRQGLPASPQEVASRDARMSAVGRRGRLGTVVRCAWCGIQFCPLFSAKRRRFCSKSCASRATRARKNQGQPRDGVVLGR